MVGPLADVIASTEPSFFTTDKSRTEVRTTVDNLASTEPSFFTTDKRFCSVLATARSVGFNGAVVLHDGQGGGTGSRPAPQFGFNGAVVLHDGQVPNASPSAGAVQPPLQRSRRSSRRTSRGTDRRRKLDALASTEPSFFTTDKRSAREGLDDSLIGFNGAVVLHDGQDERVVQLLAQLLHASTEPSFFTTDKAGSLRLCRRSSKTLQRSRRSSRRTSLHEAPSGAPTMTGFNGAVVLHDGQVGTRDYPPRKGRRFNGAVVLHDGQAGSPLSKCALAIGFNGAVVLHDGQDLQARVSDALGVVLQRSRRSSRRTSQAGTIVHVINTWLQRSRRSSRRTR